jgi:hypothetical protein
MLALNIALNVVLGVAWSDALSAIVGTVLLSILLAASTLLPVFPKQLGNLAIVTWVFLSRCRASWIIRSCSAIFFLASPIMESTEGTLPWIPLWYSSFFVWYSTSSIL